MTKRSLTFLLPKMSINRLKSRFIFINNLCSIMCVCVCVFPFSLKMVVRTSRLSIRGERVMGVCVCVRTATESMAFSLPASEAACQIFNEKKTNQRKNKQASSTNQKRAGVRGTREGERETHPFIFHVSIYSSSWRRRVEHDGREEGK